MARSRGGVAEAARCGAAARLLAAALILLGALLVSPLSGTAPSAGAEMPGLAGGVAPTVLPAAAGRSGPGVERSDPARAETARPAWAASLTGAGGSAGRGGTAPPVTLPPDAPPQVRSAAGAGPPPAVLTTPSRTSRPGAARAPPSTA